MNKKIQLVQVRNKEVSQLHELYHRSSTKQLYFINLWDLNYMMKGPRVWWSLTARVGKGSISGSLVCMRSRMASRRTGQWWVQSRCWLAAMGLLSASGGNDVRISSMFSLGFLWPSVVWALFVLSRYFRPSGAYRAFVPRAVISNFWLDFFPLSLINYYFC